MLNDFKLKAITTSIALICFNFFSNFCIAKETYSTSDKKWDLCIRYNTKYELEKNEFVIKSDTFKQFEMSYAVAFACYSKFPKRIELVAFVYRGKTLSYITTLEFRTFGAAKYFEFSKDKEELNIPDFTFKTDFQSVFYDGIVTESELEQFTKAMFKIL